VRHRLVIVLLVPGLFGCLFAEDRVVSLAPSVTETILALGLEARIIGRTRYCPGADQEGVVIFEDMVQPSVERLIGLRPDLILTSDPTPEAVVTQLRRMGLRVERLVTSDLGSVATNLRRVGELLGQRARGETLANRVQEQIEAVERVTGEVAEGKRPRVVLFYGTNPEFCAGAGSFTGEILERAGGHNVAADADSAWPSLSRERLMSWDPEVVLISLTENPVDLAAARATVSRWKGDALWNRLSAVRSGRIVFITGSLLMIPGPRVGEAAEVVARALYPDLFPAEATSELHFLEP
jgi:iron complex transport system substrate-binding protein